MARCGRSPPARSVCAAAPVAWPGPRHRRASLAVTTAEARTPRSRRRVRSGSLHRRGITSRSSIDSAIRSPRSRASSCTVGELGDTVERLTRYRGSRHAATDDLGASAGRRIAELASGDMIEAATALHDPDEPIRSPHRRKEDLSMVLYIPLSRRRRNAALVALATLVVGLVVGYARRALDGDHRVGEPAAGARPQGDTLGTRIEALTIEYDQAISGRGDTIQGGVLDALDGIDADLDRLIADSPWIGAAQQRSRAPGRGRGARRRHRTRCRRRRSPPRRPRLPT